MSLQLDVPSWVCQIHLRRTSGSVCICVSFPDPFHYQDGSYKHEVLENSEAFKHFKFSASIKSVCRLTFKCDGMVTMAGILSAYGAPIVIQPESYIVRFRGDARCDSGQGQLVFSGSDSPIVLTSTGNLQVQTTAVNSERPQDIWNQNLLSENPERYQIRQDDGNCMFVDADAGPESTVTMDVCSSSSTTFQQFQYNVVQSAPGCASSNTNGYAVHIRPAAVVDIGGDLCFSASSSSGVTVTVQPCNSADESQLFFVNVPSIITGS